MLLRGKSRSEIRLEMKTEFELLTSNEVSRNLENATIRK